MKLFLSWSGKLSNAIAQEFHTWLPMILQHVEPYISSADINKGARWATDIADELATSDFGLIFITPDNVDAPWIMFEAGALSKAVDSKAKVAPVLFDVAQGDLRDSPLLQFQMAVFEKADVKHLLDSINNGSGEEALEATRLNALFETLWPQLEDAVGKARAKTEKGAKRKAEPSDEAERAALVSALEEAVINTRNILKTMNGYQDAVLRRSDEQHPIHRLERNAFEAALKRATEIKNLASQIQTDLTLATDDADEALEAVNTVDTVVDALAKLTDDHLGQLTRLRNRIVHAKE